MGKLVNKDDTIEADHLDICSRKIDWKGLRKHPDTEKLMMLYECRRNSNTFIVKAYSGKIEKGTEHYHRNEDDFLEGDTISVYTNSKRKENHYVKEGVSGRHGSQFLDLRNRTIATIKYPIESLIKCLQLKNEPNKISDK